LKGKLETFSVPELFRLIDSGAKTGKLTIERAIDGNDCEIWFESGQILTIIVPVARKSLLDIIEERAWLNQNVIAQAKRFYRHNQPFGGYLHRMGLWTKEQQASLFDFHLQQIESLFKLDSGAFELEEIANLNSADNGKDTPWEDMTGNRIQAAEMTFQALQKLEKWEQFAELLPASSSCLQRLVKQPSIELSSVEFAVWSYTDGKTSIKTIAQNLEKPLLTIQKIVFAMSMANLLEETMPSQFSSPTPKKLKETTGLATAMVGAAVQPSRLETKDGVSTSLLHNLVSFLKGRL
jgi:hypothetical protein